MWAPRDTLNGQSRNGYGFMGMARNTAEPWFWQYRPNCPIQHTLTNTHQHTVRFRGRAKAGQLMDPPSDGPCNLLLRETARHCCAD